MHASVPLVALVGTQAVSAASIPRSDTNAMQKTSFKLPRVATGSAPSRNVVREMKAAMKKHNMRIPEGLENADETLWEASSQADTHSNVARAPQGGSTGMVSNNPFNNDAAYTSPVTIGGQMFNMVFDTGSSDLWVYNTGTGQQYQQGQKLFDPSKSTTWKQTAGASFSVTYGEGPDGVTSGSVVGTDTVGIGGLNVTNQVVELPSQVSNQFQVKPQQDGLVGLAHGDQNEVVTSGTPTPAKTWFENIASQLQEPIMGANFKHDTAGSFDFGAADRTAFTGSIQWAASQAVQGKWSVASSSYAVGSGATTQTTQARPAIADTGTTLMLVDAGIARDYYAQVPGAALDNSTNAYSFPCAAALPDLHIELAPGTLSLIPAAVLNHGPLQDPSTCAGGLQPIADSQAIQVYGDIMFKAQYVAFNAGNNSVGFAPHA